MFKKLEVWQDAMELVEEVYRTISILPSNEAFNLISQIQRSAISIPSNIAEGRGRSSDKEFRQFLYIARGSLFELRTQLEIARRLYKIKNNKKLASLIINTQSKLNALINKL